MTEAKRTQPMPRISLRLLYAEDSPADAEMALLCLKNAGIDVAASVVQTEEEFTARLASQEYDCILADYRLGSWTGLRALEILNEQRKTVPFILVTGTLGDELAVEIIKSGAADYVLKDRLTRLPTAIRHALEAKKLYDERVRAEDELRKLNAELEQRVRDRTAEVSQANITLQSILNAATRVSVIATDLAGVITLFNVGAEQMLGYSAAEMVGRVTPAAFHLPAEMEARAAQLSEQVGRPIQGFDAFVEPIRQGGFDEREWTYVRKDGSHLTVNLTVTARRNTNGSIIGFLGIATDITQRKHAEEALRQSEAQTRLLLDTTAEGIYGIDLEGNCTFCNPACVRLLGFHSPADLLGRNMHVLIHHTRADGTPYPVEECRTYRAFRQDTGVHADDEVLWRADGTSFPAEYWSLPIRHQEKVAGCVVTFLDITDRKRAEEAMRHAKEEAERTSKFKDQFLSTMSHELRTPLNAVLGFSQLLQDERYGALSDRQRRYLTHIHTGGQHLLRLINDILDLSKIEAGRLELAIETVPVRTAFGEVLGALRPLAEKKSQELSHDDAETGLAVRADATRFKQILMNLVGNAIKFTPEGGRIELRARTEDGNVRVEVRDTGPGIPPEEQKRIFEAFVRLQAGKSAEGTGLGLAITQRLVELHGGTLGLESAPRKGSGFYFSLPQGGASREPRPKESPERAEAAKAPRVLIIEDDPVAIQLIQSHLASSGYDPWVCTEPQNAAQVAREIQPDAITLAILMKPINGFEVLLQLKSDPQTKDIPVVVLTIVDHAALGSALGAEEYLVKPVESATLLAAIERSLGARGIQTAVRPILVVEDDAATREILRNLLANAGYPVVTAADGEEARRWMAASLPELVILDLVLPKVSGFELLAEWRADARTANLSMFVLTSKDLSEIEEKYLRSHAESLLRKQHAWQKDLLHQLRSVVPAGRSEQP